MIVCGLALGALARLPRVPAAVAPASHLQQRARPAARDVALRALRDDRPLDLNTAVAADLELLPGVGPALAQRIVEHRAAHGAFSSIDGLRGVRGIGPKTLARLRPLVAIAGPLPAPTTTIGRTPTPATR